MFRTICFTVKDYFLKEDSLELKFYDSTINRDFGNSSKRSFRGDFTLKIISKLFKILPISLIIYTITIRGKPENPNFNPIRPRGGGGRLRGPDDQTHS